MIPTLWATLLTLIFAATGSYSLVLWAGDISRRTATMPAAWMHLNHLVMSVAMIVMTWWPSGTAGSVVQSLVFTSFAVLCGRDLFAATERVGKVDAAAHLAMNAAMVWMLLSMPLLMGTMAAGGGSGHHHDGAAMDHSMDMSSMTTPGWATAVTVVVIAVMLASAGWWLSRLVRAPDQRRHALCHLGMSVGMAVMLAVMH